MPTYCDCEKLQKRIEELEAKLREVPWTSYEVEKQYEHLASLQDKSLIHMAYKMIDWAEKRIKERQ